MTKSRKNAQRSRQEVDRLVRRFKQSGLSQEAFARSVGIHPMTLGHWVRKDRRRPARRKSRKHTLVPVRIQNAQTTSSTAGLEVVLENGRVIRVVPGFDRETLVELIALIENQC